MASGESWTTGTKGRQQVTIRIRHSLPEYKRHSSSDSWRFAVTKPPFGDSSEMVSAGPTTGQKWQCRLNLCELCGQVSLQASWWGSCDRVRSLDHHCFSGVKDKKWTSLRTFRIRQLTRQSKQMTFSASNNSVMKFIDSSKVRGLVDTRNHETDRRGLRLWGRAVKVDGCIWSLLCESQSRLRLSLHLWWGHRGRW